MPTLTVITRSGELHSFQSESGVSVMEAMRNNGVDEVLALCGGCASCGTCHVYVDSLFLEHLPPKSPEEHELLGASEHHKPESRLSCQVRLSEALNGLTVTIAPES